MDHYPWWDKPTSASRPDYVELAVDRLICGSDKSCYYKRILSRAMKKDKAL